MYKEMEDLDFGDNCWICKPCNWFIYPDAIKFQVALGIMDVPFKCPECKGLLEREEK